MYTKHLSEPWFSLINQKKKVSEGRLNKGDFLNMKVGEIIEFFNNDKKFKVKIIGKYHYTNFKNMIIGEKLKNVLPHPDVKNISQGVKIYNQFFTKEEEKKYGVVAIRIRRL